MPKAEADAKTEAKAEPTGDETSRRDDLPANEMLAWAGPVWTSAQDESAGQDAEKKED